MGVEIQLFECYALKKTLQRYEGKTNDVLIAFIGYVNYLNKLQQFKNLTVDFNATFQPSWQQYV